MQKESQNISQLRAGFEDFYQGILQPQFAEMEAMRKKYLRFFIIGLLIIFVIIPLICGGILWFYLQNHNVSINPEEWPLGTMLFGLSVIVAIVSSPMMIFKRKSKGQVMPELVKYFGDFKYSYQDQISDATIIQSRLFNGYNEHQGDDFFFGSYDGVGMTVSEESLKFKKISEDGKRTSYAKIFQGIIILLSMNKNFTGQTVVLKDRGILNSFNKPRGLERIVLEDCIFEKEFEVYGTDQLEARYLLTTAFMERMLKVREAYKSNKIQFSFFNNNLLIGIDTNKNMFESTSLFRCTTDRKLINETFEQIISIMAVIETLKLNMR